MPRFIAPPSEIRENAPRTAVLLVNLGTPAAPTPDAVREYLAEFLSDPRVVELPRAVWWPVLHGYVLRTRPRRSAEAYAKIWTHEGSPLLLYSTQLMQAMQAEIARRTKDAVTVTLAMRYGSSSIHDTLLRLHDQGVRRVLLLPLYPQYAAATTASALDVVADVIQRLRWPPELRTVNDYHDDAGYLAALASSVQAHWPQHGRAQKLLLSFHGLPESAARKGDPYFNQCHETAFRLRDALGLRENEMLIAFQSRVGRQRWLQPYTDQTVIDLAREGVKSLDVLCPGFAVDCLETLEEIALRYRAAFLTQGGERFSYIPALNASAAHVTALTQLALRNLQGWA
ncbi:MAG TPA: ferrochelatase [Rhodanobacteraceae bacterium]|nr:ferrochelatase [Rhodanobacteraceae bacterium]